MTRGSWWRWLAVCALVPAVTGCAVPRGMGDPAAPPPTVTSAPSPSPASPPAVAPNQDPARFAEQVLAHAREARVNPQLVMAILYNESYKPHDPATERAWLGIKPDAALGIANMHQATFEETKRRRGFANRDWQELPDDPDLAIQAAAWYLHDLAAALPAKRSAAYSADELLALGYNAGPDNMTAFARGSTPGHRAQEYLDTLHGNWEKAGETVRHG